MASTFFTLILCVAVLLTAMVGSWVWTFHESDAAGQGLAKAYTVIADMILLLVTAVLLIMCGARGGFTGIPKILVFLLFAISAGAQFGVIVVLSDLASGDRFEWPLRLLAPAGPALLLLFAAMQFYGKPPSIAPRIAAMLTVAVAIASAALIVPARADSNARQQARQKQWEEAQAKDQALLAEVRALPDDTPLVDFLRYTDEPPAVESETRREAINRMSNIPDRQKQVQAALNNLDARLLPLLDKLDLRVTPELCEATRKCWRKHVENFKPTAAAPTFSSVEDRLNQFTICARWLLEGGCDCKPEIALLEQNVRLYPDPYPKKFFIDYLLDLQGKPRE